LLWLHGREKENFLDVAFVRQKHSEAIDAQAPTAGGWKSVLQSDAKVLVAFLCVGDIEKNKKL
jgi:hypothetical protein